MNNSKLFLIANILLLHIVNYAMEDENLKGPENPLFEETNYLINTIQNIVGPDPINHQNINSLIQKGLPALDTVFFPNELQKQHNLKKNQKDEIQKQLAIFRTQHYEKLNDIENKYDEKLKELTQQVNSKNSSLEPEIVVPNKKLTNLTPPTNSFFTIRSNSSSLEPKIVVPNRLYGNGKWPTFIEWFYAPDGIDEKTGRNPTYNRTPAIVERLGIEYGIPSYTPNSYIHQDMYGSVINKNYYREKTDFNAVEYLNDFVKQYQIPYYAAASIAYRMKEDKPDLLADKLLNEKVAFDTNNDRNTRWRDYHNIYAPLYHELLEIINNYKLQKK